MFSSESWLSNQQAGFYNGVATQSLRFDDGSTSRLTRTPSSAGNRRTWTFSCWYKRSNLERQYLFGASANYFTIDPSGAGTGLEFYYYSGGYVFQVRTNAQFRDVSSWYHFVLEYDTTQATASNRVKIYVNGEQQTDLAVSSYPSQNAEYDVNNNVEQLLGINSADTIDGYMSEVNFVDGQALEPEAFGETKNGVWIPKKYETKPSLIAQGTGTAIGDMTSGGGLAGAFNGTQFQSYASSAQQTSSQATSFIGKNWGSSKTVTGFILYSNTQFGFTGSGASTFTVKLYGKNGNPSNSTDGTLLFTSSAVTDANSRGSIRYFADTNIQSEETISSFNTTTAFTYHWVVITPNTSEGAYVSEIEFYEDGSTYYGTNGFRLAFNSSDFNESGSAITDPYGSATDVPDDDVADASGSGNHFNVSGLVTSDFGMPDSPENGFANINPLNVTDSTSPTFSEGNLKTVVSNDGSKWGGSSTIGASSGKYYFEVLATQSSNVHIGVADETAVREGARIDDHNVTTGGNAVYYRSNDGNKRVITNGSQVTSSYASTYTTTDIIGVAFDVDGSEVTFFKNNSSLGAITIPTTTENLFIALSGGTGNAQNTFHLNAGADSSFAGNKTAQGNTDGKGIGDFYYAPPSGFLALCSANLPEPTISPNADTQADDYFTPYIWTGNDTNPRAFTDVGFQADWIWIKKRSGSGTSHHLVADSSRGDGKTMLINEINQEATNDLNGTISDTTTVGGFTVNAGSSSDEMVNDGSDTYVAWLWKANGGTTSSNSDGSITSTVQANTTSGFSIVTYTGNQTIGATIGHGLGVKPDMIIFKNRDSSAGWATYHKSLGATKLSYLDLNNSSVSSDAHLNNTEPTSSVITLHDHVLTNGADDYVAYCFHSVEGYSKFGSYTGGGTSLPFIYTGFAVKYLMMKRTDGTGRWYIWDNTREEINPVNLFLRGDISNAESGTETGQAYFDFLSNGFKLRANNTAFSEGNTSGANHIYMAFAENPFKYSTAQ